MTVLRMVGACLEDSQSPFLGCVVPVLGMVGGRPRSLGREWCVTILGIEGICCKDCFDNLVYAG